MSESTMRKAVLKALKPLGAFAVENSVYPGTPDVNCDAGWIELKEIPAWPKRTETELKIEHFTVEQRNFLEDRWARNQDAWMLLKVGRQWMMFDGVWAADNVGHSTRARLEEHALWVSQSKGEAMAILTHHMQFGAPPRSVTVSRVR